MDTIHAIMFKKLLTRIAAALERIADASERIDNALATPEALADGGCVLGELSFISSALSEIADKPE